MPELPEVETVRRILEKEIVGMTFSVPQIVFPKMIKSDISSFSRDITGKRIISLSRRGKFLILHLTEDKKLLFHLRMEGKLFVEDKAGHETKHMTLFLPFENSDKGLAFYDVRKFGICQLIDENQEGELEGLGKEPFEIDDPSYLLKHYSRSSKMVKECLLDQTIMSGLGNIYADEVLFACGISPFRIASSLTLEDCKRVLEESKRILSLAIENNGSTVKSYKASESVHGDMQNFLKVYSRKGEICTSCKTFKIEKRRVSGRGTSFCPYCQTAGISVAVTGKIASGKSLVVSMLEKKGFLTMSMDKEVAKLYKEKSFLSDLRKQFPEVFSSGNIDKAKISSLLIFSSSFRRRYQNFIFKTLKDRLNDFLNKNDSKNKAIEIPLLFEARMNGICTFDIGTETTKQKEHLLERGEKDVEKRLEFNNLNSFDKNKNKLDLIISTDGTIEELQEKVDSFVEYIEETKKKASANRNLH